MYTHYKNTALSN